MKNRQEFEASVAAYAGEVKKLAVYFAKLGGVSVLWLIVLRIARPMSLPPWQFGLLVVVCPVLIVAAGVYRGRKLDLVAKDLGLRCHSCKRWFTSQNMADQVRKNGLCPNCSSAIFTEGKAHPEHPSQLRGADAPLRG